MFGFRTLRSLVAVAALVLPLSAPQLIAPAHAAPAIGDFDGDLRSDMSVALVDRAANRTDWLVRRSNGQPSLFYTFNRAADAFVTGRYYAGLDLTYPGIIRAPSASAPFEWYIKNPYGAENTFSFGVPGDSIPNQGDVDCDGVTDVIVTRPGTASFYPGGKLWYFALSGRPGVVQVLFGNAGDRAGTADMDGDGCAELIVLSANFTWFHRPLFIPGEIVKSFQWGLPGDVALLPQDLNADGKADYVISRQNPGSGAQEAFIKLSNGIALMFPLGLNTSIPMMGTFTGNNTFAWIERAISMAAIRTPDGGQTIFPFSIPQNIIIRPDGTVVHPNISPTGTPLVTPPPAVLTPAPSAPAPSNNNSGNPRCDDQIRRNDGSGGFKNNPENSKGTLKIMLPKSYTDRVRSMTAWKNGDKIDTLKRATPNEWGDRMRYYGTKSLRSYPKDLLIVVEVNNGKNACVTLPDATRVID